MNETENLYIDEKAIERLKRIIIMQENKNLKSQEMNDSKMIDWIKKKIEEEVQCLSNQ